ncbi:STE24 endopeptidase [Desulfonauticus submarinus]|uniref:STE24 endopeptidase n=1 Tax=Desulfonauticus submarinus TaxID=206665 RepID=A0A1H0CWB7_9BACT|nr:M48 family metallopeptidase [Desulfonauticus submarinus]SDN62182.1 STE24 endopeptidase [Desulfonauticus submarinus]
MNSYYWQIIILTIIFVHLGINLWLEILNIKSLKTKIPPFLQDIFSAEKYKQSQSYTKELTILNLIEKIIITSLLIIAIKLNLFNYLNKISISISSNYLFQGTIFFFLLFICIELISFPFELIQNFYLENKYGFNKMSFKIFLQDKIKTYILSFLLGGILLITIFFIFKNFGKLAWLYAFLGVSIFMFIIQYLAPKIILPLFNKFIPISDSSLKQKIHNLAQKIGYKIQDIYIMDGSKRTTKANAFLTGFGKYKKIALFDNLVNTLSHQEIIAVLAHELAHFKLKHIFKQIILSLANLAIFLITLQLFLHQPNISKALGIEYPSIHANLLAFSLIFTPLSFILGIMENFLSRKFEKQADMFALKFVKSQDLISALKKLAQNNLSNLTPHPIYVFFFYSHPPLTKRIKYLQQNSSSI